ncbi:MAG: hypothetical protein ACPGN3_14530 [Opitutales bacterium]
MNQATAFGIDPEKNNGYAQSEHIKEYTDLKLEALGLRDSEENPSPFSEIAGSLLKNFQEKSRLLSDYLPPVDARIQAFIDSTFGDVHDKEDLHLPSQTFTLDQHGMARLVSLPEVGDTFESPIMTSYRVQQGVLHNPLSDRRTTKGVFHVCEDGLPIADDKKAVPRVAVARLLAKALKPPKDIAQLPYLSGQKDSPPVWVSLMLRPLVCPEVPGFIKEKRMEVRFFAPGTLVSNLDFVESIFGNAGDPTLADNDAGLDIDGWTGTSGCVILAPHLNETTKKELGLPHISEATERQKRDGMCWEKEDELYNEGGAFKVTIRDQQGTVVTLISDSYFGYCKKEVKTQIGYSANLMGICEEEHAGGALVYSSYDLGEEFQFDHYFDAVEHTFSEVVEKCAPLLDIQEEGYAIDKKYPDIWYVPEDVRISLLEQKVEWNLDGKTISKRLVPETTYVLPSGYKVEMVKPAKGRRWRLKGTVSEGLFCHKPCTVSGGGKSEISKSISDAIISGPVYIKDYQDDFAQVDTIFKKDVSNRFNEFANRAPDPRPFLDEERSLGSVIKLLTPSPIYTVEYNAWLDTIPQHIKDLAFVIKRFYRKDWGDNWQERFSVDTIDGRPGNELRYKSQKLITQFLRVGYNPDGTWRTFSLRKDFMPAIKISQEDDISGAVVVPSTAVEGLDPETTNPSMKFIENCESRFFQRPDDAIHRGYDIQTELDMAGPGNLFANYEPLTKQDAIEQFEDPIRFEQYTQPVQDMIKAFIEDENSPEYFCSPANPRIVDGKPTKNPRYQQVRPDLLRLRENYLCDMGTRLNRKLSAEAPVHNPVGAVLPGRRNNPPELSAGIRSLAVYNPIHYMELPELFMEFIASITGKSPSTTGAGSEGAMTKAPFNCLWAVHDLNAALISFATTQYDAFLTSAGCTGPDYRVDHDVSLLIPELWSRMRPEERKADYLIEKRYIEPIKDFEYNGETIPASRLGYRITDSFVRIFFGRIFNNPSAVFPEEMLKPETQGMDVYVDGIKNIADAHQWVAQYYLNDGSVEEALPPLKALLYIMATGSYEGKGLTDPEIRAMFEPEAILNSDYYAERLSNLQTRDAHLVEKQKAYIAEYIEKTGFAQYEQTLADLDAKKAAIETEGYTAGLKGTLGCGFNYANKGKTNDAAQNEDMLQTV